MSNRPESHDRKHSGGRAVIELTSAQQVDGRLVSRAETAPRSWD
ncbi:hypothetical protein [Nonomuraea sp. NPDC049400]